MAKSYGRSEIKNRTFFSINRIFRQVKNLWKYKKQEKTISHEVNNLSFSNFFSVPSRVEITSIDYKVRISYLPWQVVLSLPNLKPVLHKHLKLPKISLQVALQFCFCAHLQGFVKHSFTSKNQILNNVFHINHFDFQKNFQILV